MDATGTKHIFLADNAGYQTMIRSLSTKLALDDESVHVIYQHPEERENIPPANGQFHPIPYRMDGEEDGTGLQRTIARQISHIAEDDDYVLYLPYAPETDDAAIRHCYGNYLALCDTLDKAPVFYCEGLGSYSGKGPFPFIGGIRALNEAFGETTPEPTITLEELFPDTVKAEDADPRIALAEKFVIGQPLSASGLIRNPAHYYRNIADFMKREKIDYYIAHPRETAAERMLGAKAVMRLDAPLESCRNILRGKTLYSFFSTSAFLLHDEGVHIRPIAYDGLKSGQSTDALMDRLAKLTHLPPQSIDTKREFIR